MAIYRDIYDGPPRSYQRTRTPKRWIVIHCTQNTASAANEASYAKRRTDSVSSHYYVDNREIVQSLDTDYVAFHVGSITGNLHGISYEITGLIQWSRSRWLSSVAWDLLATQIRRDCAEHGIIPRLLTTAEIRAGKTGIITHNQARLAWGGTDHTDPGPNFPMDHLLSLLTKEDGVNAKELWGHRIPPEASVKNEYPGIRDDGYRAGTWVQYAYRWARRNNTKIDERAAELLAGQAAILSKLDGGDDGATRQAIRDELDRHRAALLAEMRDDLDELAELVRRRDTGELTAEQVVDELARRLSGGGNDD